MNTEYWLLKKTLGGWSKVTWYSDDEFDKAQSSYQSLIKSKGYAYKLVKVETLQEHLLEEMIEIEKELLLPDNVSWGTKRITPAIASAMAGEQPTPTKIHKPAEPQANNGAISANGWGTQAPVAPVSTHGLVGSVWVVHHGDKVKKRIQAHELASYEAQGYVRGGPRTQV